MRPLEQPPARVVLGHPVHFLAFGLGSGLSPVAPGTAGSLAAIPLAWLMAQAGWPVYAVLTLLALVAGFWICGRSATLLGVHDHRGIVWDEFVGQFIALFLVPWLWYWVLGAFLLFRFFDIVKPWPARIFDRDFHNGVGIVMDDVVAGVYAWLSLWALIWLLREQLGWLPA